MNPIYPQECHTAISYAVFHREQQEEIDQLVDLLSVNHRVALHERGRVNRRELPVADTRWRRAVLTGAPVVALVAMFFVVVASLGLLGGAMVDLSTVMMMATLALMAGGLFGLLGAMLAPTPVLDECDRLLGDDDRVVMTVVSSIAGRPFVLAQLDDATPLQAGVVG